MYKEIQPYCPKQDPYTTEEFIESLEDSSKLHPAYYAKKGSPIVIRLEDIKRMESAPLLHDGLRMTKICISNVHDEYVEDIIVSAEEGDAIKKMLLEPAQKDALSQEVHYLTTAVRDLWQLLRARLH